MITTINEHTEVVPLEKFASRDFRGRERFSVRFMIPEQLHLASVGNALAYALKKAERLVDKKVGTRERVSAYYYITYEVVVGDDSGDKGGPVRPPIDGTTTGMVFADMSERSAA